MSYKLLLTISSLLFILHLHAQRTKWWIGPHVNYTEFKNERTGNEIPFRLGSDYYDHGILNRVHMWHFGIDAERRMNEKLFLQTGIYWSQISLVTKMDNGLLRSSFFYLLASENDQTVRYIRDYRLATNRSYLSIPLAIRYEFWQAKKAAFYVSGGITTSFAIAKPKLVVSGSNDIEASLREQYISEMRDVFSAGKMAVGIRIGRLKNVRANLDWGIAIPLTSNMGSRKIGVGFNAAGTLLIPIKVK